MSIDCAVHAEDTLADYFDGRSARPCRVRLVAHDGQLQLHESQSAEPQTHDSSRLRLTLPLAQVRWPERTRHGARVAHLPESAGGGELHALDPAGWDRFAAQAGLRESLVVRSQQSWRGVLVALGLLLALLLAGWRWGVPLAAQTVVAVLPADVDAEVGALAFEAIERRWLKPSALPSTQQAELRAAFAEALRRAEPGGAQPYRLEFRASRIGPNALALPGGTIVLTDELVKLVDGQPDVLIGVLAHEYGHVKARHGMRQVVQAGVLGAVGGIAFGDYSGLLATLPVLLGSLSYSRDFEREADDMAIEVLRASGRSPAAMVTFFERMAEGRKDEGKGPQKDETAGSSALGIALSSHPADAERIARFRAAAATR